MSTLPVFPIVKRAFVFLALNLGTLLKLYLTALGLILAAVFLAAGAFALTKAWLVAMPCVVFILFAGAPCMMRTYQLAALGEMDPSSYLSSIFTSQSLRYVGYSLLVTLISGFGLLLSLLPAILTGALGDNVVFEFNRSLSVFVSIFLVLTFLVLIGPINLIYPAVSLEREPSLAQAYALGAHCKVRLFWTMAVPGLLFGLLSQGVEMIGGRYGVAEDLGKTLLMAPLNLILVFMSLVINSAVFALAYRYLRGLPHHDPSGPLPGEAPAWPGGFGPAGPDPAGGQASDALTPPPDASASEAGPTADVQSFPDAGPAPAAGTSSAPEPTSEAPTPPMAGPGSDTQPEALSAPSAPVAEGPVPNVAAPSAPESVSRDPAAASAPSTPASASDVTPPAAGPGSGAQPEAESARPEASSTAQVRAEEDKTGDEAKNKTG